MQSSDSVVGVGRPPEPIRSPEGQLSPFGWYAEMREERPVHYDEQRETWDVFRYDDVNRVLKDHVSFTAKRSAEDGEPSSGADEGMPMLQTMITTDPPEHTRLRGFVDERFQPGSIREYRPQVERVTEAVLDDLEGRGQFDFVDEVAISLPVTVIAELLGIPAERRDQFKAWSDALVARPEDDSQEERQRVQDARQQAQREMGRYFGSLLQEREGGTADDLITLAANSALNRGEQIGFCMLLLLAGNITTTNLLTNAIWTFEEEGLTDAVRQGAVDLEAAIEETLRYRSPIQSLKRIALEDVELRGRQIQAGDVLTVWLGAANRDPARFDAPEEFRPERQPNRHIAFGTGVHFCLGAHLARMEAAVALNGFLERFDRLDADLWNCQPLNGLYGLESLPCDVSETGGSRDERGFE
ncbi:cytochrome P450 (plasmid) [Halostagnicola larsenii XH-48]|uniref:Cytochrome P450 n=1 Tax=Halostagnicola larsenii XH-48 TaxID=797299 RepID=W0JYX4_9EURY|nr:cytochrome P450 [Halostagnicola larsenii]AHG02400.1 cytochrome P450 [Halostagnicola larsenii XH-48]